MGKLRELISDSLIYGVSSVVARFVTYLLVPFYTKVFDPAEYGIIGLIYVAIVFLNIVFTFGTESAYLRYGVDREKASSYFKTLQMAVSGLGAVSVVLLWLIQPLTSSWIGLQPEQAHLYFMMLGILYLDALTGVPFAELRLMRRSWTFALIRLGNTLLTMGLNFWFVLGLGWGLEAVLAGNLIASALTLIVVNGFCFSMWSGTFNKAQLETALRFGLPYIPAGLAFAVNEGIDRFFLNAMSTTGVEALYGTGVSAADVTGVYNACYKLSIFMVLFVQMYKMAWQPFFMRNSNSSEAPTLFADSFRLFNYAAAGILLFIGTFSTEIVQIKIPVMNAYLIDPRYWWGLSIVPILLTAYIFQGWYVNFMAGVFIKERTGIIPYITMLGAAITLIANASLVPLYGMNGAALATLLSYVTMAFVLYFQSKKLFSVDYSPIKSLFPVIVAVTAVYVGLSINLLGTSAIINKLITSSIASTVLISLFYFEKRSV